MFHSMFHPCWPPQLQLHSLMAIASFSISFHQGSSFMQYFIPSGIHFNQIFISSWQLLHSPLNFVSFPVAAISFLLACISLKISFLHGSWGLYPPPHNLYGLHWTPLDSSAHFARPNWLVQSPIQWSPVQSKSTGFHWIIAYSTYCY